MPIPSFSAQAAWAKGLSPENTEHLAVEVGVGVEPLSHRAELLRAHTREGHGDKKKEDIPLAELLG